MKTSLVIILARGLKRGALRTHQQLMLRGWKGIQLLMRTSSPLFLSQRMTCGTSRPLRSGTSRTLHRPLPRFLCHHLSPLSPRSHHSPPPPSPPPPSSQCPQRHPLPSLCQHHHSPRPCQCPPPRPGTTLWRYSRQTVSRLLAGCRISSQSRRRGGPESHPHPGIDGPPLILGWMSS